MTISYKCCISSCWCCDFFFKFRWPVLLQSSIIWQVKIKSSWLLYCLL